MIRFDMLLTTFDTSVPMYREHQVEFDLCKTDTVAFSENTARTFVPEAIRYVLNGDTVSFIVVLDYDYAAEYRHAVDRGEDVSGWETDTDNIVTEFEGEGWHRV